MPCRSIIHRHVVSSFCLEKEPKLSTPRGEAAAGHEVFCRGWLSAWERQMSKTADGVVEVEKGQSKLLLATTNQAKGEGPTRDEEESSKLTWRSLRTRERRKERRCRLGRVPRAGKRERKKQRARAGAKGQPASCASRLLRAGRKKEGPARVTPHARGEEKANQSQLAAGPRGQPGCWASWPGLAAGPGSCAWPVGLPAGPEKKNKKQNIDK